MRTLSIVHPSRSRPKKALETMKKWIGRANNQTNIQYVLSIDLDDHEIDNYFIEFANFNNIDILIQENKNAIEAINKGALLTNNDIIIVISDDFDCPMEWDNILIEETKDLNDFVLKTDDGIQDWIVTLPIMDRIYYERFGYIYHPDYTHLFSDTDLTTVASLTNKLVVKKNIKFEHIHHTITTEPDEISNKIDNTWEEGEKIYFKRLKENFDLPLNALHKLEDCSHKKWIINTIKKYN